MGMSAGGGGNDVNSEINVTPMIDVLLVLLIIFMIVQALSRTAIQIVIPPPDTISVQNNAPNDQLVLELRDDGSNWINGTGPIPMDQLDARLHALYDGRPTKLLFLKPGKARKYFEVTDAVDIGRGAGVQVFGFTPIEAY